MNGLAGENAPAACWPQVAATGHRPHFLPARSHGWVARELRRVARKLHDVHGMRIGISGGAMGTDLWWADAVRATGADVWVYRPFPQQPDRWDARWREHHARVLGHASRVVTLGEEYRVSLLHARNARMLRDCQALVAVLDPEKRSGGTYATVAMARGRVPIVLIDPRSRTTTLIRVRGQDG